MKLLNYAAVSFFKDKNVISGLTRREFKKVIEIKKKENMLISDRKFDEQTNKLFQKFMEGRHTNIKFTIEANQLAFLDMNITRDGESFLTKVFRKNNI